MLIRIEAPFGEPPKRRDVCFEGRPMERRQRSPIDLQAHAFMLAARW
jgi:hypothetical protein